MRQNVIVRTQWPGLLLIPVVVACTSGAGARSHAATPTAAEVEVAGIEQRPMAFGADRDQPTTTIAPPVTIAGGVERRVLATDASGSVVVQATPFALRERSLPTTDRLDPPPDDGVFRSSVGPLTGEPLARSTWMEGCPVERADLAYATVSFRGFDDRPHTGELIVASDHALGIIAVFEKLFDAGFPIEEMRIVEPSDLVARSDGDTNNTASFVCRPVTGGSGFSEHAYGLAIDLNPFQNPYVRETNVIPSLAGSFADRAWARPGMIEPDGIAVRAFAAMGWRWGGGWRSLKDYQHFSHNGR